MNPQEGAPGNDRVENEHDSSFSDNSFSSDDEFKRDAHYRPLYRQDSEENSTFDEESTDDDDADQARANENGLYNHNVIVEWISTNEPLFDRAEYEARLRRIIDEPANMDESDSDYDVPKENNQTAQTQQSSAQQANQPSTSSSSKSDIQIGEDKSKTIIN